MLIAKQYEKIEEKVVNDGYQVLHWNTEMYLNDPREVKPEDIQTEDSLPTLQLYIIFCFFHFSIGQNENYCGGIYIFPPS